MTRRERTNAARNSARAAAGANSPVGAATFDRQPARRFSVDAGWLLGLYLVALLFVPANQTISAMGSTGTPALLIGLFGLVWWFGAQVSRTSPTLASPQPLRRAMLGFMMAILISYVFATVRPIDGLELNAADRGILLLASWLGIVLMSSDGLLGLDRIEASLRLLVFAGATVAVIGVAQFATGDPLIDVIQIPGLSQNNSLTSIYSREGFTRAAGTSTHPIELGVILAMILPVALHFALTDTDRNRVVRWFPVAAIAFAVPITISRSAILGVFVALLILMPSWSVTRRRLSYVVIASLVGLFFVTVPGMLGTLTKLFTGISEDSSARSRTDSYSLAFDFIQRSPLFGRGFSTFLPEYRILDNQYLGLLIEVGVVGTLTLLTLFALAIGSALRSRRWTTDPRIQSLAQALGAMAAVGACTFSTFDAFSFPQASGLMFFSIGLICALSTTLGRQSALPSPVNQRPYL